MPPKRKKEESTSEKNSPPWKAFLYRYRCIFITIIVLVSLILCIQFLIHYTKTIKSLKSEINDIKVKKDSCDETKDMRTKGTDISNIEYAVSKLQNAFNDSQNKMATETTEFQSKLIQLEHDIQDNSDKDLKKEKMIQKQYEKAFNDIKTINTAVEHSKNTFWTLEKVLDQKFENQMHQIASYEQRAAIFENSVEKCSKEIADLSRNISDIQHMVKQHIDESSKERKKNDDREFKSKYADIFLVGVVFVIFVHIVVIIRTGIYRKEGDERSRLGRRVKSIPLIISFRDDCIGSHDHLAKGFIDEFDSIVISNSKNIRQIHAKDPPVCFVFVDYNERNIILEGEGEPQQIRKETVEYIMNMGGIPVIIYHLHPDSKTLEEGRLYSSKLTSIQQHPILKELSKKERILSIYREFSEFQKSHLKNICRYCK